MQKSPLRCIYRRSNVNFNFNHIDKYVDDVIQHQNIWCVNVFVFDPQKNLFTPQTVNYYR